MRLVAVLVALVGCQYTEARFGTDYANAMCAWSVDCFDIYADVDECLAEDPSDLDAGDGAFDEDAAKECVRGLRTLTCPADNEVPAYPAACGCVYGGCSP